MEINTTAALLEMVAEHLPPFSTRRELAKFLRTTEHWLAREAMAGRGPAMIKMSSGRSGTVRYSHQAIAEWLEQQSRGGVAA